MKKIKGKENNKEETQINGVREMGLKERKVKR